MLAGQIEHDRREVDGRLERIRDDAETERLMWLHAQLALECLGWLERLNRGAAGVTLPGPHPSDVLQFVADAIENALDGHPPPVLRNSVGNVTGAKERDCIAFAKSYEEFAGEMAPDGTRLLPDDDALTTICEKYDLTRAAYRQAKDKLRPGDRVIFLWARPRGFRLELLAKSPDERLDYARERIKRVGGDYQWVRANRLTSKPRTAKPTGREAGKDARPAGKRRTRKK